MKEFVFCIYDKKACKYGKPILFSTDDVAMRSLRDFVTDKRNADSELSKYSEDFQLHLIGTFDDMSGAIQSVNPKHICDLATLKQQVIASDSLTEN